MKSGWLLIGVLALSAAVFVTGISWGLSSSEVNPYLFGDRTPWTGQQIIDLAGAWDTNASVGADVDRNPLQGRDRPIWLNETDAQRAEIVRRYRLFSYQPDEMITLRALSQIKPATGQFDPKLYQYGGLWMYPVGAMLKSASIVGAVHLTPDLTYYLDHPEAFGRFYVVARLYSVLWGLIGVVTVFYLVKKLANDAWLAALAAAGFAVLPVVVCMSHEAKPHLAGAVLMLLAIVAAMRFLELGTTRLAAMVGVLCGAASGMVLTSAPIFLILPAMVLMRENFLPARLRLLAIATACCIGVYAITNPYVIYHLFFYRELLASNAGNTQAMYAVHDVLSGILNAMSLIGEGSGWAVLFAGVIGWLSLHFSPPLLRKQLLLLAIPAVAIAAVCSAVAAGKPGEFGRFFILPDVALLVGALVAIRRLSRPYVAAGVLVVLAGWSGSGYLGGFYRDACRDGSREWVARTLTGTHPGQAIGTHHEPAPYDFPPIDLFKLKLMLLPPTMDAAAADVDFTIDAVDAHPEADWRRRLSYTRISWANKPLMMEFRKADQSTNNTNHHE